MRSKVDRILKALNPPQGEAVTYPGGPLLVFAGAGSGKTRVLTHRIAYLIATGAVSPDNVLAVTFTNKAAGEMRERIEQLLQADASRVWAGTFHSFCAHLLRRYLTRLGRPSNFVIFDEDDQGALLKQCVEALGLPADTPLSAWRYGIERAKDDLLGPDDLYASAADFFEQSLARLYEAYQKALEKNNALDFDDLIAYAVRLLESDKEVAACLQQQYEHLLVDEFQDINLAQYRLVRALAGRKQNVTVVGDDDQSIYGWRGARVELLLHFHRDFPKAKVVVLEQNYRSTQNILEAAFHVISHNTTRAEKRLWTDKQGGELLYLFDAPNEQEEAYGVAAIVRHALSDGRSPSDFTVLYRTNAQSRVYEEAFMAMQVPYRLVGSLGFYERAEVKDILAYLRVLHNPADSVSLRRIINCPPRGIGDTTVRCLQQHANQHDLTLHEALHEAANSVELVGARYIYLAKFVKLLDNWRSHMGEWSLARLVTRVVQESGYREYLQKPGDRESRSRLENLEELVRAADSFEKSFPEGQPLAPFLERVALLTSLDVADATGEAVTVMTLHSAKGLEFNTVFLVGLEEGLFPHQRSMDEGDADLEEERRLCYVGLTRAKECVFLSFARTRARFGQSGGTEPSRFLLEIPPELLDTSGLTFPLVGDREAHPIDLKRVLRRLRPSDAAGAPQPPAPRRGEAPVSPVSAGGEVTRLPSPRKGGGSPPPATPAGVGPGSQASRSPDRGDNASPLRPGDKVLHKEFGEGVVVQVRPDDDIIAVAFPNLGIKRLAASLAPLRKKP